MLDASKAMVAFLNLIAAEPDIARVPVMVDSSKWEVIEAGLKCLQGKGHRQLDLDEGRRGGVSPGRGWPLRRGGGGDGVRRTRARPTPSQRKSRSARAPTNPADRADRFPARGHHLRPQHLRGSPPASRAQQLRVDFIEATRDQAGAARLPYSGGVSNVSFVLVPRQRAGAEAIHVVFLYHAIQAGMDMGIVNAGALPLYDDLDPTNCASASRTWCSTAASDGTERLLESPNVQGQGGRKKVEDLAGAGPVREAPGPRAGARHRPVHRGRHRGKRASRPPAAGRDRRPADGRHERGRRPVRRRQDVLPQVVKSARVMKKAVAPAALHRGGKAATGDAGGNNGGAGS